jgi:ABC-type lipoprotein release transport system permease subunit
MIIILAMRNLARNVRRTVITVLAVGFGLALILLTINLQTGQYDEMIRSGVSALAGHVVVQREGFQKEQDSDLVVTEASAVASAITGVLPDAVVAPRLLLGGLLVSPTGSVGVALSGVDGAAEARVQDLHEKVTSGTWLDGDDRGIVLGSELARSLSVALGDKVVYMGQHGGSTEVQSRLFRVKGIFRTGAAELDGFGAFADLPAVQEVFGVPDVANRLTVHLADPAQAQVASDRIEQALVGREQLEVRTWWEALPEMYGLIQIDRVSGDVMLGILGVIVAMGVVNTLLMSVLERTREFGVMLALGLRPWLLVRLILAEGALLGGIGATLGLAGGLLLSWPIVQYGIDYSEMLGSETMESGGVVISSVIHGRYNPVRMAAYTVGAVLFTTLSAIYPALYVARLEPVDAMRHV